MVPSRRALDHCFLIVQRWQNHGFREQRHRCSRSLQKRTNSYDSKYFVQRMLIICTDKRKVLNHLSRMNQCPSAPTKGPTFAEVVSLVFALPAFDDRLDDALKSQAKNKQTQHQTHIKTHFKKSSKLKQTASKKKKHTQI